MQNDNDLHSQIVQTIFRIHNLLVRHGNSDQLAGAFGLTQQQWTLLSVLSEAEHGMKMTDLGKILLVTKANMTGMIDRLERYGYVRRMTDAKDRRITYVVIEEKGRRFLQEIQLAKKVFLEGVFQSFSGEEQRQLLDMLQRIFQALND